MINKKIDKTIYKKMEKILSNKKTVECIDYTHNNNHISMDFYDIGEEKELSFLKFFKEIESIFLYLGQTNIILEGKLYEMYVNLRLFHPEKIDGEISGAQARIEIIW